MFFIFYFREARHANNAADFGRTFRMLGFGANYPARCAGLISEVAPRRGVLPKADESDLIRPDPTESDLWKFLFGGVFKMGGAAPMALASEFRGAVSASLR